MQTVTYSDLVERHGQLSALKFLRTLEKMADIQPDIVSFDCEARFQKAFQALCAMDFSASEAEE